MNTFDWRRDNAGNHLRGVTGARILVKDGNIFMGVHSEDLEHLRDLIDFAIYLDNEKAKEAEAEVDTTSASSTGFKIKGCQ